MTDDAETLEKRLIEAFRSGKASVSGLESFDLGASGRDRTLDAGTVRAASVKVRSGEKKIDPKGARIKGFRIGRCLDLSSVELKYPLHFEAYTFNDEVDLSNASVAELSALRTLGRAIHISRPP